MRRSEVLEILNSNQTEIEELGVRSLSVFGSVARDEAGPKSDVDLLVELSSPMGLIEFVRLKNYLEELLGCRVDLVTPSALRSFMREQVLKEAIRAT